MFGVPLEVAVKQTRLPDGVELPRVFREGIVHIDENCTFLGYIGMFKTLCMSLSFILGNFYCQYMESNFCHLED